MTEAIRIDRDDSRIYRDVSHCRAVIQWMQKEALTEDEADALILAGRVEYGYCWRERYGEVFRPASAGWRDENYRTVEDIRRYE